MAFADLPTETDLDPTQAGTRTPALGDSRWTLRDLTGDGDGTDDAVGASWLHHVWMGTIRDAGIAVETLLAEIDGGSP